MWIRRTNHVGMSSDKTFAMDVDTAAWEIRSGQAVDLLIPQDVHDWIRTYDLHQYRLGRFIDVFPISSYYCICLMQHQNYWYPMIIISIDSHNCLVVWLPFFIFPFILGISHHPNWLSYFSEGGPGPPTSDVFLTTNHYPMIIIIT